MRDSPNPGIHSAGRLYRKCFWLYVQILDYIKEKPTEISDGDFECLIESAISHSMSVTQLTEQHSEHRLSIIRSSQRILRQKTDLIESARNLSISQQHLPQLRCVIQKLLGPSSPEHI